MIDPSFRARLHNWSRYIKAASEPSDTSSTYRAMEALRLFGPSKPAEEERKGKNSRPIDCIDAEKLCKAYAGPWLSTGEKNLLAQLYGFGISPRAYARQIRVHVRFLISQHDLIIRKFQLIVEKRFDGLDGKTLTQ